MSTAELSFFALLDRDRKPSGSPLKFAAVKINVTAGMTMTPEPKAIASLGFGLVWYFPRWREIEPFVELGSGVVYTDFEVPDRDDRFNLNPRSALGIEYSFSSSSKAIFAVRYDGFCSADFDHDNEGIGLLSFEVGTFF